MENDFIGWAIGGGLGTVTLAALARFLSGIWTRDQANRTDLKGNLTVLGNQGRFIDDLIQNISDLRRENAELRLERDEWQRRYYDCFTGRKDG